MIPFPLLSISVEVEHVVRVWCLLVKVCSDERTLAFINIYIYAPINSAEKKTVFREGQHQTENHCGSKDFLISGGDFNCTEFEFLDRNRAEPHPGSQHALKQLFHSHGLVDVVEDAWRLPAISRHGPT